MIIKSKALILAKPVLHGIGRLGKRRADCCGPSSRE